jgi:hypothetical protein
LSLCPGTRAGAKIPEQTALSQDKLLCPGTSKDKLLCPGTSQDKITFPKKTKKQEKDVLEQQKDVINRQGSSKTGKDF